MQTNTSTTTTTVCTAVWVWFAVGVSAAWVFWLKQVSLGDSVRCESVSVWRQRKPRRKRNDLAIGIRCIGWLLEIHQTIFFPYDSGHFWSLLSLWVQMSCLFCAEKFEWPVLVCISMVSHSKCVSNIFFSIFIFLMLIVCWLLPTKFHGLVQPRHRSHPTVIPIIHFSCPNCVS